MILSEEENGIDKEPGVYTDITFDEYTEINAINHSTLTKFMEMSPFHYKFKKENDDLFKDTKAISEGRVIHEAVLEPEKFKEKYIKEPNDWREYREFLTGDEKDYCKRKEREAGKEGEGGFNFLHGSSNAKKKIMQIFENNLGENNEPISAKLLSKCRQIRENLHLNDTCENLFEGAEFEVTLIWIDEETDLKCKGRLDVNSKMRGFACDLKKTKDANPKWIPKDVMKYNYNSQAAFYMDGAEKLGIGDFRAFVWIMVESTEPHYVIPYYTRTNSDWITNGRSWYRKAIEKLNYCRETGDWHGYYDAVNDTFDMYQLPEMFN